MKALVVLQLIISQSQGKRREKDEPKGERDQLSSEEDQHQREDVSAEDK